MYILGAWLILCFYQAESLWVIMLELLEVVRVEKQFEDTLKYGCYILDGYTLSFSRIDEICQQVLSGR
jgi:hypothetical protein